MDCRAELDEVAKRRKLAASCNRTAVLRSASPCARNVRAGMVLNRQYFPIISSAIKGVGVGGGGFVSSPRAEDLKGRKNDFFN